MKNIVFNIIIVFNMMTFSFSEAKSQASFLGNNSGNPTDYSGWDNTVTFPLNIRHDAFYPIIFSTNATERMRIAQWGNVSVGDNTNPRAKLEITLYNENAAAPPYFESTAVLAYNRFMSEEPSGFVNRGIRAISEAPNNGLAQFNGSNMGGTFWARRAAFNIGVFGNASWVENLGPETMVSGISGIGVSGVARGHNSLNVGVQGRVGVHPDHPGAWIWCLPHQSNFTGSGQGA